MTEKTDMTFMQELRETLLMSEHNLVSTENGAKGYATTGKALLDLNFAVSSLRAKPASETERMFDAAYRENRSLAIAWLFFARDIRGNGLGERRLFRICLHHLAMIHPEDVKAVLPLIPEYGRWDDMIFPLMGTPLEDAMMEQVCVQLMNDKKNCDAGKSISLLAKWLPSYGASDAKKRHAAARIIQYFGATPAGYKATLSKLRRYLGVVECRMSTGRWGEIDYSAVPSRANMNYNNAFLRHDEQRRREFLASVKRGEAKINSSALYPHEIVARYEYAAKEQNLSLHFEEYAEKMKPDENCEAMWRALPDYVNGKGDTLVVCDTSGSMMALLAKTKNTWAMHVSVALAIYFATHMQGDFRNSYIQFSSKPYFVHLKEGASLLENLVEAYSHNDWTNTDLYAVMMLVLETATKNRMTQEHLPKSILIISDMEFDAVQGDADKALMDIVAEKFKSCGYKLPRVVFWNVCSRTMAIPVFRNELGVCLVSGYSPAIAQMVLGGDIDPYKALVEAVTQPRYERIWQAMRLGMERVMSNG